MTERGATPLDGAANGVQQHIVLERLRQELDRSRLHRLHAHRHVTVAGDEDDRHVGPLGELLLQLETVESWQRHVEHQAARNSGARAGQEFLCRCERFGLPAAVLISSSNDSRTEMSSSTTKTMAVTSAMVTTSIDGLRSTNSQYTARV